MNNTLRITIVALSLGLATGGAQAQSDSKTAPNPAAQSSDTKKPSGKAESVPVIHPTAQAVSPLKVGEAVPTIPALKNAKGEAVNLADATKGKTTVLVFYRGGWCPYCNTHLAELAKIQPHLASNKIQILAVSPDSPETLKAFMEKKPLPYTLLSDSDHDAMKAFGVAFAVDAATLKKYESYGIDLTKASGNTEQALPVPSVFVVNPEGKITFAHSNADYAKRLSGEEILKAAGIESADSGAENKKIERAHDEAQGPK